MTQLDPLHHGPHHISCQGPRNKTAQAPQHQAKAYQHWTAHIVVCRKGLLM